MQDRLNLTVYADASKLMFMSESYTRHHEVVYHMPPIVLARDVDDETLGKNIIACANRSKGLVDEPSTMADDVAKAFGFKSDAELNKKTISVAVARRDGAPEFAIYPTKKVRRQVLFFDDGVKVPIDNPLSIGAAIKNALTLSS